jgi:hypothetical protein
VSLVQIPAIIKHMLLRTNLRRAADPDGQLDFKGGPFPEKFVLEFDR